MNYSDYEFLWFDCKETPAPKEGKFLFHYDHGIGLGQWGQCYTTINGNSERTHEAYILILHPSEILDGSEPYCWSHEKMIEMGVSWKSIFRKQKEMDAHSLKVEERKACKADLHEGTN
jgi:hypothetical protein